MSVAEQMNSGEGFVEVDRLQYDCSVSVMVPGSAAEGFCVLPTALNSG